jgi:3-oxoacyl-[acyl-carrier-protein] synthase II
MRVANGRRVVITGLGLICPLGNSVEALWEALVAGTSGVRTIDSKPSTEGLPISMAARAWDFSGSIDDFGPLPKDRKKAIRKGLKVMCLESQMGVAAAQLALAAAGSDTVDVPPERSGVVFGADYMLTLPEEFTAGIRSCGNPAGEFDYSRWATDGLAQMQPLWLLKYLPNMPASHIAIYNDFRGPNNSITHREAAGNLAIGEAYHTILRGAADRMVAGATGTRVHPMKTVHAMQTEQLANGGTPPAQASRPFDLDRTGMVLGEGAGAVVLEELDTAVGRGATIYGEILGAGSSTVVDRSTVAKCDVALANAMRAALRHTNLAADQLGHIHAHGLSTVRSDIDEARAVQQVFGDRAQHIPVVAAKSHFGNLGAGSGVVELIASTLAIRQGHLFPVLNYAKPDPDCPVTAVTSPDHPSGDCFVSINTTPQGQAAAVVVGTYR